MAGGSKILQIPLTGGINGVPGDVTPRGPIVGVAQFDWDKKTPSSRWMFLIKPYIVRGITATIQPEVKIKSFSPRARDCYIQADRERVDASCVLTCDDCNKVDKCWVQGVLTQNGKSDFSGGVVYDGLATCRQNFYAQGDGGGGSLGFTFVMRQIHYKYIEGAKFTEYKINNQTEHDLTFQYDNSLLPPKDILAPELPVNYHHYWKIEIRTNTDEYFILTNTQPSDPHIGNASISDTGELKLHILQGKEFTADVGSNKGTGFKNSDYNCWNVPLSKH